LPLAAAFADQGRREGPAIRAEANLSVAVEPNLAWAVLTDYNRFANFVADIKSVSGNKICGTTGG
jgi:hypothetical protein